MKFNGHFNTLGNINNIDNLATLQRLFKKYDWDHDPCLITNKGQDTAFKDSHCIHFTASDLMCTIRTGYQQDYTDSTLEIVICGETITEEMQALLPNHYHLKSHFVAIEPGGQQVRHSDDLFYHGHSRRLVTPIITTDKATTNFDDTKFSLNTGTIYEMNNRIPHWSENHDGDYRIFLFADFIPPDRLGIIKKCYNFKD